MTSKIISQKIDTISGPRILYQAGWVEYYSDFNEWLNDHRMVHTWASSPWFGWAFDDPVDDVAIRMQWSQYFLEPITRTRFGYELPSPSGIIQCAQLNVYWREMQQSITNDINAKIVTARIKACSIPPA